MDREAIDLAARVESACMVQRSIAVVVARSVPHEFGGRAIMELDSDFRESIGLVVARGVGFDLKETTRGATTSLTYEEGTP